MAGLVERVKAMRARRAEHRVDRIAARTERARRKAEADAVRLERKRRVSSSAGDGGGGV